MGRVARGEIEWSVALREAAEVRIFSSSYKREKRERRSKKRLEREGRKKSESCRGIIGPLMMVHSFSLLSLSIFSLGSRSRTRHGGGTTTTILLLV